MIALTLTGEQAEIIYYALNATIRQTKKNAELANSDSILAGSCHACIRRLEEARDILKISPQINSEHSNHPKPR